MLLHALSDDVELFSNIFATVATRKFRHSFGKTSFSFADTPALYKKLSASVPTSMSFGSFKLSLLLTSSLLSCCGVVALSIFEFFYESFHQNKENIEQLCM